MILGVGIDIVKISRFVQLYHKHGSRFLQRVFHKSEIENAPKFKGLSNVNHPLKQISNENIVPQSADSVQNENEVSSSHSHFTSPKDMKENMYFYQYYASRWAAKEAFLKALGQGSIGSKCVWIQKSLPHDIVGEGDIQSIQRESIVMNQLNSCLKSSLSVLEDSQDTKVSIPNTKNNTISAIDALSTNQELPKFNHDPLLQSRLEKPFLLLEDRVWNILEQNHHVDRKFVKIWCSLSHESDYAVAQVVIESIKSIESI